MQPGELKKLPRQSRRKKRNQHKIRRKRRLAPDWAGRRFCAEMEVQNFFKNEKGGGRGEEREREGGEGNPKAGGRSPSPQRPAPPFVGGGAPFFFFPEHGDVIDFVGRLFQLSPYDAARKLMTDFHLSPDKPPSAVALHAKRIRTEAQQLMENERLCFSVLSDYAHVLRDWKVQYAPQSPDEPVHARFVEACRKLDRTEYYLDILCADKRERGGGERKFTGE